MNTDEGLLRKLRDLKRERAIAERDYANNPRALAYTLGPIERAIKIVRRQISPEPVRAKSTPRRR